MSDELDALRPPVRVGAGPATPGAARRPEIDARAIIALSPPGTPGRLEPTPGRLGVLGPDRPPRSRHRWVAAAAAVVVLAGVGLAVYATAMGGDSDRDGELVTEERVPVTSSDSTAGTSVEVPATVDQRPVVTFTVGRSAQGQPGCSVDTCRFVDVALRGFEPGSEVVVTCHGEATGAFSPTSVVIGTDGTAADTSCYFGYPGQRFWVDADGVVADSITWPG